MKTRQFTVAYAQAPAGGSDRGWKLTGSELAERELGCLLLSFPHLHPAFSGGPVHRLLSSDREGKATTI